MACFSIAGMLGQLSPITDSLFLCGFQAITPQRLKQKAIKLIINATVDVPNPPASAVEMWRIPVHDRPHYASKLSTYFDEVADKIHQVNSKGGKVIVHCVAGVSRSATLVIVPGDTKFFVNLSDI